LRAWRYRSSRAGDFRPWFLAIVYRQCRGPLPDWLPLPRTWDRAAPDPIESAMDSELLAALRSLAHDSERRCGSATATTSQQPTSPASCTATRRQPSSSCLRARDALRERLRPKEEIYK